MTRNQAVLKPINGLLSIGVVRVNDSNHLRKVYKDVIGMMDGMYLSKDGKMGQMGKDGSMPDGAHPLKCQVRASSARFPPPGSNARSGSVGFSETQRIGLGLGIQQACICC